MLAMTCNPDSERKKPAAVVLGTLRADRALRLGRHMIAVRADLRKPCQGVINVG